MFEWYFTLNNLRPLGLAKGEIVQTDETSML